MDAPAGTLANAPSLEERAFRIRRNALRMGEVQGQGYIAQALGVADVLAVSYFHALRYRPEEPYAEDRDRFLLSIGHYAIALYAALIEAEIIPEAELETYGSDDSRLPMSGMAAYTPGMEISGGSLGIGLGIAVGMCLGLKRKGSDRFVYNLMSDGELNEGPTWEAAMSAGHWKLDNLICLIDVNRMQADGVSTGVLNFEPLQDKWQAFGWHVQRVDGNDIGALVARLRRGARARRAEAAGHHLRHQDGEGRALPRGAREVALPARGATRMGRGHRARSKPGGCHEQAWTLARRRRARRAGAGGAGPDEAAAHHLGHDRLARGRGAADEPGPVRAGAGRDRQVASRHRRHDGRPQQVHRPAHLRAGVSRTASTRWAWPSSC